MCDSFVAGLQKLEAVYGPGRQSVLHMTWACVIANGCFDFEWSHSIFTMTILRRYTVIVDTCSYTRTVAQYAVDDTAEEASRPRGATRAWLWQWPPSCRPTVLTPMRA